MKLSKQPSFRRILLLRIIIVSVPVLLIGVAVAFRQARTTFQESANKNLSESAERKAATIETTIQALQASLVTASETLILRTGTLEESQAFLEDLAPQMPLNVNCLQLADWQTGVPLAGTCDIPLFDSQSQQQTDLGLSERQWPLDRVALGPDPFYVHSLDVQTQVAPDTLKRKRSQLNLVLSTPVYDENGKLRSILLAQGNLTQRESGEPRSLLGYTIVIDTNGIILAHPLPEQVGQNIRNSKDSAKFQEIVKDALQGEQDVGHLDNFNWLAGYSSANVSVSPTEDETWVVLAVAQLDAALYGLNNIKRIVLVLTGALTLAHLLAMFYMARDLARPIEQLGEYASRIHDRRSHHTVPENFQIRELNQLSSVLDNMVKRLEDRAQELETAWQEAQAANKLKDEILANTSHELRTPLNAIIGCVRIVKDDLCENVQEEEEYLERADEAAIHLLKIINDILDIAKIESGTSTLSMEDVEIDQTIREVIALQAMEAHQKGLWLLAESGPSVVVQADAAKLKQVFLNIIGNAIKFTDQGGITIETQIQAVFEQSRVATQDNACSSSLTNTATTNGSIEHWAVTTIKDTGIGIDPDQLTKLGKPFQMGDGSKTRKHGGTGLGLAISCNLVKLMGGQLSLHSEGLGKGTTVKVTLPIVKVLTSESSSVPNDSSIANMGETEGNTQNGKQGEYSSGVLTPTNQKVAIAPPL